MIAMSIAKVEFRNIEQMGDEVYLIVIDIHFRLAGRTRVQDSMITKVVELNIFCRIIAYCINIAHSIASISGDLDRVRSA